MNDMKTIRARIARIIIMAAVSGMLFASPGSTAERTSGDPRGKAQPGAQLGELQPFSTVRDGTLMVRLPAGSYRISSPLRLPSNTALEGEGDTTVIHVDASFSGPQVISNSDHAGGNKNISIRNLRMEIILPQLQGDSSGILRFRNVEHLEIDNLTMAIDSPMYGIDLSAQIRKATVQGCTITNMNRASGGGIMIRNGDPLPATATSGIVVRHNRIGSVSDEPIAAFGWEGMVENVRIENNTISADGASFGITAFGIDSRRHRGEIHDVSIIGNHISGSRIGGIGIKGGARTVRVIGNSIEDAKGDGVFLHPGGEVLPGVRDIRILRNRIMNAGRHGIFAAGTEVAIEKNTIKRCAGSGVYASGNVSVTDNIISDASPGILAYEAQRNDVRGNHLRNAGIVFIQDGNAPAFKGKDAR